MEAIVFNVVLKVLQFIFGWLFKMLKPITTSIFNAWWPVIRMILIVAGLIAATLIIRQVLTRNPQLVSQARSRLNTAAKNLQRRMA
jgi:fucose permease